ncbi:MAG: hypothetical protein Q9222_007071 [Ikaeria aurantiellina]
MHSPLYPPLLILSFFFLLALISPSHQVDVLLGGSLVQYRLPSIWPNYDSWHAGCRFLQPGECCSVPPNYFLDPGFMIASELQPLDIGFLWKRRSVSWLSNTGGCSGTPFKTHMGGLDPTWRYGWNSQNPSERQERTPVCGFSYLRMPPRLPPDETEASWLDIEGMKGFAWGGGKWFANQVGYPLSKTHILRRDEEVETKYDAPQISNNRALFTKGTFYATPPPRQRFVDWIEINGTNYTHAVPGELKYSDSAGHTIDFNATGS